jgi:Fe-S-cluster containining protein
MDEDKKYAGEPMTFARHYLRMAKDPKIGMNVPCGTCNACCRSNLDIALTPEEAKTFEHELDFGGMPVIKPIDGKCPHLIDDKCSVYDRRPLTCRRFDCRVYFFGKVNASQEDKSDLNAAINRWYTKVRTPADAGLLISWRYMIQEQVKIHGPYKLEELTVKPLLQCLVWLHKQGEAVFAKIAKAHAKGDMKKFCKSVEDNTNDRD